MLETEIQGLLDADAFRKAVTLEYKNTVDLYEVLAQDNTLTV